MEEETYNIMIKNLFYVLNNIQKKLFHTKKVLTYNELLVLIFLIKSDFLMYDRWGNKR